jgi:uncharacterized lipoprotein YehR (DUF1307 family)
MSLKDEYAALAFKISTTKKVIKDLNRMIGMTSSEHHRKSMGYTIHYMTERLVQLRREASTIMKKRMSEKSK